MSLHINKKIWVYVERLYIHCYKPEDFIVFLNQFGIEYDNKIYKEFDKTKPLYEFMSEENYDFANFMQTVASYKYLPILEKVVFDKKIKSTKDDNWNYYGEYIRKWYDIIIDLLKMVGVNIDRENKKLVYEEEEVFEGPDFLPYSFNDMFLDYIRKEINECYKTGQLLAVMILSRKILEVLFVRILQIVFPKIVSGEYSKENHYVWYNHKRNRYHNFENLIKNMKDNSSKFHEDKELIENICSRVKPFKDETNLYVHRDYKIPDETYLKSWRVSLIVELVRKIYKKYCNP